jgi:hypothetical protein
MFEHRDEGRVLQDIGEISGVIGVAVVRRN